MLQHLQYLFVFANTNSTENDAGGSLRRSVIQGNTVLFWDLPLSGVSGYFQIINESLRKCVLLEGSLAPSEDVLVQQGVKDNEKPGQQCPRVSY